jgi:hypothetical protein
MAASLGLAVLRPGYRGARVPVMEHCMGASREVIRHFSGIDPLAEPERVNEAFRKLAAALEIDLLWGGGLPVRAVRAGTSATPGALRGASEMFDWSDGERVKRTCDGRAVVQWGIFGAAHQEDGRHFVHIPKPASVDEALAFEPLEHFPRTVEEYRAEFTRSYADMWQSCGDTCVPLAHHYTTCFHWPLAIFGFELLCAAGLEEARFARLMEKFAEVSWRISTAWSQVPGLAGFILHDDLTMTSGPVFRPEWYREHIFCHYPRIFGPLKRAGVPLVFTSDGDCTAFVEDIFAAGADGLNFEYLVDLRMLVEKHPDKILIGNINSAVVGQGKVDAIERATRACLEIGARAPRFVLNIGGGITHDMTPAALEAYLRVRKALCRSVRQEGHALEGESQSQ